MQMQQQPVQPAVMQQATLQPPPQPASSKQVPTATGLTSSQMADSFRGQARQSSAPKRSSAASKIPSIRLSFITASDQAKFEQLFKSAVGTNQAMSGDQAKELLFRSKLSGEALAHIWSVPLSSISPLLTCLGCSATLPNPANFSSPNSPWPCIFAT
jgi:hypothetical protein